MLENISDVFGVPLDKIKYLLLFFLSFPLAIILRSGLHYSYTSTTIRHCYSIVLGVLFGWICFHWKVVYLVLFVLAGYVLLLVSPPQAIGRYTVVYALLGVTAGHIYRLITDYGGYTLDFTGPLMVMVQRVTYVAYAYHDGAGRDEKELTEDQKKLKISTVPSLLEYFSYNFNFMTILAGPTTPYKEYDNFIIGRNITNTGKHSNLEPSPLWPGLKKFLMAVSFLLIYTLMMGYERGDFILDTELSLPRRILNVTILSFVFRCRYYFTYTIVEAICNTGGLGFNGYTEEGEEKWDLVMMIDIGRSEFVNSARDIMMAWNMTTHSWLKRIFYDRSNQSVLWTNVVGALWHGLYPGYFMTYVVAFLCIYSGRKIYHMKLFSSYQSSHPLKVAYNAVSLIILCGIRDFVFATFWLLITADVLTFWGYYYYLPLIIMTLIVFVIPDHHHSSKKQKKQN